MRVIDPIDLLFSELGNKRLFYRNQAGLLCLIAQFRKQWLSFKVQEAQLSVCAVLHLI